MSSDNVGYKRAMNIGIAITLLMLANAKKQGKAHYGRFGVNAPGVKLDPRLGWWLMELPATLSFLYHFYIGTKNRLRKEEEEKKAAEAEKREPKIVGPSAKTSMALFLIWCIHYGNRGWFFPLTIRVAEGSQASFALHNSLIGAVFLSLHGYLNARMFSEYGKHLQDDWLKSPQFITGLFIYACGYALTVHSESVLRNLRPLNEVVNQANRYKIPYGGGFDYVTNPQYLGELTAWLGFNILSGMAGNGLPVLFISLANLVPRAFENHKWYLKKFPDYPKDRTALIPFVL